MNKVIFDQDFIAKTKKGMDIVHKAVAGTLGASGRNVVIRSRYSGNPQITNDGVTIARSIVLQDEEESIGADLIKQASERTNEEAGDGTSTAIVLSHALIEGGLKKIAEGKNPMALKKEIEAAKDRMIDGIKKSSKKIQSDEELFNVANISMENPEIAKVVVDAVKKAGENGTVLVEESNSISIERNDINGIQFDSGYVSSYMATNPSTMEASYENVPVLILNRHVSLNKDIFGLLEEMHNKGNKELVIICEDMYGEILSTLIKNKVNNNFYTLVVRRPQDPEMIHDIAALVGATVVDDSATPKELNAMHVAYLGKAQKVIATSNSTLIVGGYGNEKKIEERIQSIKKEMKETDSPIKKEVLKHRLAKIVGGVVILKVGAPTESEMKYLKLKIDDAVSSTISAMEEGIVLGGGKCLFELSRGKPVSDGEEVLFNACKMPMIKIMENAGVSVSKDVPMNLQEDEMFDAVSCEFIKASIKSGIIDPAKVERCALKNAVSLAAHYLTAFAGIVDIPKENKVL